MNQPTQEDLPKSTIQQKIEENLKHKGYEGSAALDHSGVFYGKIKNINDLVTYEASSTDSLRDAFIEAVDDYLLTCATLEQPV